MKRPTELRNSLLRLISLQDVLRVVAVATVTRIVILSDRNGDMIINLKELNESTLKQLAFKWHGVDLDEDTF